MCSNKKFIYAIAAFIAFKLIFISFALGFNSTVSRSIAFENFTFADPMESLFRIIFILFIISPPLIVVLLFLIWRELKERNKMK